MVVVVAATPLSQPEYEAESLASITSLGRQKASEKA